MSSSDKEGREVCKRKGERGEECSEPKEIREDEDDDEDVPTKKQRKTEREVVYLEPGVLTKDQDKVIGEFVSDTLIHIACYTQTGEDIVGNHQEMTGHSR